MAVHKKSGLGRGLSALMADVTIHQPTTSPDAAANADRLVSIEKIQPNPDQPRRVFDQDELSDLAASIQEKGVIQPLILRNVAGEPDRYEIVAGERRWRAAQIARLHEVPALIRDYSDSETLEIAIIENVQRADLNAIEEAAGYRELMDRFGHTQEKLAEALGKSRPHIANLLRLLSLPDNVQNMLQDGRLTAGHARALIAKDDPEKLAKIIVAKGLSVRDAEKLVKRADAKSDPKPKEKQSKDADTKRLEQDLAAGLGMKVEIDHSASGTSGQVRIKYSDFDDLDEICRRLADVKKPAN